ncbi:MAG: SHOCT domain-containing protein [Candidatus Saccharibacteria bacterium]
MYDNTAEKICPVCHEPYTDYPALSRKDNKTYICPACGVQEALADFADNQKKTEIDIAEEAKAIRVRRLSKALVNLIDLKVRGIITEEEFKQSKKRILGF